MNIRAATGAGRRRRRPLPPRRRHTPPPGPGDIASHARRRRRVGRWSASARRSSQGDKVVVIEAMKMKTPMIAHRAGTVTAVAVKAGDAVEAGQVLVSLA